MLCFFSGNLSRKIILRRTHWHRKHRGFRLLHMISILRFGIDKETASLSDLLPAPLTISHLGANKCIFLRIYLLKHPSEIAWNAFPRPYISKLSGGVCPQTPLAWDTFKISRYAPDMVERYSAMQFVDNDVSSVEGLCGQWCIISRSSRGSVG